uniref:Protein GVQW3-like n=1 Tax=Petromyzon marinus TaxID=7757 RepID=A0AAJ7WZA3_PETMA|nr:protein GVQW3-like [Petromyzon marinus]XP_032814239.1 protein GVQW3-like [Petromyzon marinus]
MSSLLRPPRTANVEKIEQRIVIKFLSKEGNNAKQIHERMLAVYGAGAPSYPTVARWFGEFRRGRESIRDGRRSGRPSEAVNAGTIARVKAMVARDGRVKVSDMEREVGISHGSVLTILHEHLGLAKVSARWVPTRQCHGPEENGPRNGVAAAAAAMMAEEEVVEGTTVEEEEGMEERGATGRSPAPSYLKTKGGERLDTSGDGGAGERRVGK